MADKIEGPLGIWPFPIINAIIAISNGGAGDSLTVTEVHRDDDGRITSIEEFAKE